MILPLAARRLGMALVVSGGAALVAQPAMAQSKYIERTLAGVKLNSTSRTVLAKFGNPNEIYIGDIGVRVPGTGATQGGAGGGMEAGGGMGGPMMGGMAGPMMGGMTGPGGMGSSGMAAMMGGRAPGGAGPMMGGMTGPGSMGGLGGGMGSSGMGAMMGGRGPGGMPMGGMTGPGAMAGGGSGKMAAMGSSGPGAGLMGGMGGGMARGDGEMPAMGGMGGGSMGAAGGGIGAFGQTQSRTARQQEVTWVFNRLVKDAKGQNSAVSYEFLINPSGSVSQIRCLGYQSPRGAGANTPSIVTERGIRLNSTYADVLRAYGQPESYEKVGNVLVLSYPKRHIQFQLINQREQASPVNAAYKVIAITIATIEG